MGKPAKPAAPDADRLFERVADIIDAARSNVARAVNCELIAAYWEIGREIVSELQGGEPRAGYGKRVVEELSQRLTERFGRGFSVPNLWNFRQFYLVYSRPENSLSSTRRELQAPDNQPPADRPEFSPHRVEISRPDFHPKLSWFYHIRLRCYVIVDLKVGKLTHGDIGQMQMYVGYYDREIRTREENPSIGLVLCADKNDAMVKYILGETNEQIFASRYRLELPDEETLRRELEHERRLIERRQP